MSKIDINDSVVLITGVAGFIGANLAEKILVDHPDAIVVGIDDLNDYYDIRLKRYRLERFLDDKRLPS